MTYGGHEVKLVLLMVSCPSASRAVKIEAYGGKLMSKAGVLLLKWDKKIYSDTDR